MKGLYGKHLWGSLVSDVLKDYAKRASTCAYLQLSGPSRQQVIHSSEPDRSWGFFPWGKKQGKKKKKAGTNTWTLAFVFSTSLPGAGSSPEMPFSLFTHWNPAQPSGPVQTLLLAVILEPQEEPSSSVRFLLVPSFSICFILFIHINNMCISV